jgi:hypothetical protein
MAIRLFLMACVKFKPNFGLKNYFFYFVQSFFKTSSIRFSISNSILFKYYFFINFLLLFSTQLKPNKQPKKKKKPTATSTKKNPANLQTFTEILQKNIKTSKSNGSMSKWVPLSSTSRRRRPKKIVSFQCKPNF